MNVDIIETIGIIFAVLGSGIGAYIGFCKVYEFWTKNSIFYRFHVEENKSGLTDGKGKVTGYLIAPTITITNLSDFEWRIKKICIAQLPWIKSMMTSARGCGRVYKIDIDKLDMLSEYPLDKEEDGSLPNFYPSKDLCLPVLPKSEWKVWMVGTPPAYSLNLKQYKLKILRNMGMHPKTKKIKPKRHYWIAIINEHECLVGSKTDCIAENTGPESEIYSD